MRQRFVLFAVAGLLIVAVAEWNLRSRSVSPLLKLENFWLEFCVANGGDQFADPAVTVVRIDDGYEPLSIGPDSPAAADGRLSRLDFATILGFIGKLEPRSVAFLPTPTFDENLTLNKTDIVPLKDAAMQLPRLVLAANVSDDGEQAAEANPLSYGELQVKGDPSSLLPFTRTVRRPDPQLLANGDPAIKRIESARDLDTAGDLRVPLVANNRGKVAPSFLLAAVANQAGVALSDIVVDLEVSPPVVRLGEIRKIPIAADGTFRLPPRNGIRLGMKNLVVGADGAAAEDFHFTSLTVDEIAYTGEEEDEVAKRIVAELRGKFDSIRDNLVLIGFDRTADRRLDPGAGSLLSDTMKIARAAATIQSGRFLEWWPSWARWIAIAAIFAVAAVLLGFNRGKFLPAWIVAFLAYFGICIAVFRATLTWTPPFFALGLFLVMLAVGLLVPKKAGVARSEEPAAE